MPKARGDPKLNANQQRFCDEYMIDLNGTKAAIRAGYNEKTARTMASKLLTKGNVKEYLESKKKKLAEKTELNEEWIIKRLIEVSDRCMQVVPVMIKEDGLMVESGEFKFDSQGVIKSTELLGRHLGMFEKSKDINGNITININDNIPDE